MKLKTKKNNLLSTAPSEKHDFGIGDTGVIIEILRNRLYSNPIQTLTQEYLSNGRDANREAKHEKTPLVVTLPTKIDSVLKIRDNGPGLSPDRVKDVFVLYGASTKRTDNTQTGGFGIGAKSAWAYTDSFTIISYYNKVARTYVAHTGSNSHGTLELIEEEKTSEPNGVEIHIPVKSEDREQFKAAVFRSTFFWSVRPTFKGITNVEIPGWYKKFDAIVGGTNWGVYDLPEDWGAKPTNSDDDDYYEADYLRGLFVIDGIPYSVPESVYELDSFSATTAFFERGILAIFFKTGEIQVSASREAVVVEKENFKQVSKRLQEVTKDVVNSLKEEINKSKDVMELKNKMKDIHGIFSSQVFPHLSLKKTLSGKKIEAGYKKGGRWGDKNVPFFKVEGVNSVICKTLSTSYRSTKLKEDRNQPNQDPNQIVFFEHDAFYIVHDDETATETALKRIKSFLSSKVQEHNKTVSFSFFKGDVDWCVKNLGAMKFSEIPKIARVKKDGPEKPADRIVYRTHYKNGSNPSEATTESLDLPEKVVFLVSQDNAYWNRYKKRNLCRRVIDEIINGLIHDGYAVYSFSEKHRHHFEDVGIEFSEIIKTLSTKTPSKDISLMLLDEVISKDSKKRELFDYLPTKEFLSKKTLSKIKNKALKESLIMALEVRDDRISDNRYDYTGYLKLHKKAAVEVRKQWKKKRTVLMQLRQKMGLLRFVNFHNYYSAKDRAELQKLLSKFLK